ncbi:hypothetical protein HK097_007589 [Rhizophlyctis rosea]|uniref:SCP domain-containing protein n=1 Tax=Rhizophlyctis rosea TaxID=64517 RepID=A0AAD5X5D5_9FUNG|nr:hypothetical protein HK097_007589 [Rhizophlyctis rosea]
MSQPNNTSSMTFMDDPELAQYLPPVNASLDRKEDKLKLTTEETTVFTAIPLKEEENVEKGEKERPPTFTPVDFSSVTLPPPVYHEGRSSVLPESPPQSKAKAAIAAAKKKVDGVVHGWSWDLKYWAKTHRRMAKILGIVGIIVVLLLVIIGASVGAINGKRQQQQNGSEIDNMQTGEQTVGIASFGGDPSNTDPSLTDGSTDSTDPNATNSTLIDPLLANGTLPLNTTSTTEGAPQGTTIPNPVNIGSDSSSSNDSSNDSNDSSNNNSNNGGGSNQQSSQQQKPQTSVYSRQPDCTSGHNSLRSAYGLPRLTYSTTLENFACNHVRKLLVQDALYHSGGPYGENLWRTSGTDQSAEYNSCSAAMSSWAWEKRYYRSGQRIPNGDLSKYGHWSQLMWKDTRQVGCCRAANSARTVVIWACEYTPRGNVDGQAAY